MFWQQARMNAMSKYGGLRGIFCLEIWRIWGGIQTPKKKFKLPKKYTLGPLQALFSFVSKVAKILAKTKIKIIGLDLYESFQKRAAPLVQVSHFFPPICIYIAKKLY
jgi:hypothetical protein